MKINKICIENFRCFKHYEIDFGLQTTVLIGKNGTGKTNLITALKQGMSFMFASNKEYKRTLNFNNNCKVRAFRLWDTRFAPIEGGFCFPTENTFEATFNNKPLSWSFLKKNDPGKLYGTNYIEAQSKILRCYNKDIENSELPVLAFFSDSYPHISSNVGTKAKAIVRRDMLPRDFGYYGWDENTNCAELWHSRYIKCFNYIDDLERAIDKLEYQIANYRTQISNEIDKSVTEEWKNNCDKLNEKLSFLKANTLKPSFENELAFINNKIEVFTEPLRKEFETTANEFQISRIFVNRPDRKTYSIEFSYEDGKSMYFDSLPQGYKRLLSIVFDISYRAFILNKSNEPKGIVFIDEVELHLHPSLQQEVLERFRKTFPQIQFIVSTHSPLVISNLKADGVENKIIKLQNDGLKYTNTVVENVYGIDYTTNLMQVMDTNYRPSTIDKMLNAYFVLKGNKRETEANMVFEKLKEYLGGSISELLQKEIDNKLKEYV